LEPIYFRVKDNLSGDIQSLFFCNFSSLRCIIVPGHRYKKPGLPDNTNKLSAWSMAETIVALPDNVQANTASLFLPVKRHVGTMVCRHVQ